MHMSFPFALLLFRRCVLLCALILLLLFLFVFAVVSLLLDDFLLLSLLSGHKSAQVVNYFIIKSATGHTLAEKGRQQTQEAA